jgi:hypothetical protein
MREHVDRRWTQVGADGCYRRTVGIADRIGAVHVLDCGAPESLKPHATQRRFADDSENVASRRQASEIPADTRRLTTHIQDDEISRPNLTLSRQC